jgi:hypothetical protein
MKIGDVGGLVSASALSSVRHCGMDSRLAIVQKSINGLTIEGRTSMGTWLQASDRC